MTTMISKFRRAALAAGIALSALSVSLHAEAGSLKLGMMIGEKAARAMLS